MLKEYTAGLDEGPAMNAGLDAGSAQFRAVAAAVAVPGLFFGNFATSTSYCGAL